jgi:hypothetical protein
VVVAVIWGADYVIGHISEVGPAISAAVPKDVLRLVETKFGQSSRTGPKVVKGIPQCRLEIALKTDPSTVDPTEALPLTRSSTPYISYVQLGCTPPQIGVEASICSPLTMYRSDCLRLTACRSYHLTVSQQLKRPNPNLDPVKSAGDTDLFSPLIASYSYGNNSFFPLP